MNTAADFAAVDAFLARTNLAGAKRERLRLTLLADHVKFRARMTAQGKNERGEIVDSTKWHAAGMP